MFLRAYLATQDGVHGVEAASSSQLGALEALVAEEDGGELVSQFVKVAGFHLCRRLHLLDVLQAATHTQVNPPGGDSWAPTFHLSPVTHGQLLLCRQAGGYPMATGDQSLLLMFGEDLRNPLRLFRVMPATIHTFTATRSC